MKEYPISDDIALLNDKLLAAEKIRDLAVKLPFGYRKAFKAATEAEHFKRLFWSRVRDVYPELNKKSLEYLSIEQVCRILKQEAK